MGTALSGKVYRIVAPARGAEDEAVLRDARDAWPIGRFDGNYVYAQPYPRPLRADVEDSESAMPGTPFERRWAYPVFDEADPIQRGDASNYRLTKPRVAALPSEGRGHRFEFCRVRQ